MPEKKYEQKGNIGIGYMDGGEIHAGVKVAGVIYEGDTTTSAEQRASSEFSLFTNNNRLSR